MTDAPVETREALQVDVRIRLGKHFGPDGAVERLLSEAWTEVTAPLADGGRVKLGATHKQAVFTHPHPDPEQRKVRVLHPSMGLGELPSREIRPFEMDDLLATPEGFTGGESVADREEHVWSYQQTDPNRHIHAMEYVRVMEAFAADQLARRGRSPQGYFFARARVLFRRPCFTGEWYRRAARRFTGGDGEEMLIGTIHASRDPGAAGAGRPAAVVQLFTRETRKSLQSS